MERATRRRVLALLMGAVLAASLFARVPDAPKAEAAVHNLFPADADGFPKGRFRADEALFVTLTSDFFGGAVCVVDASVTDPATANCLSPRWGEANQYVAIGTLLGVPFEKPLLRPGTWKLLATDTTGKVGNELSEPFEVVSCTPTCDTAAAMAQLAPWKAAANRQVPTAASEERALAIDIATRTYKIMKAGYAGLGFGLAPAMLAGGWTALNFDFVVPSTEDLAKALHKQLSATVREMYKGIADDPPDPNYDTVPAPVFTTLDPTGDALLDDHLDALMRAEAYGKASRIANERYQGAVIDADHEAASIQAEATAELTYDLIAQLRRLQELQPQVAATGWANEPIVEVPAGEDPATWWTDLVAGLSGLDASSLSAADRQFLLDHGVGITDAQIDAAIARWSDPTWVAEMQAVDPTQTIADALDADTALLGDTIQTFDAFGRWMSLMAVDEQAQVPAPPVNHAPVAAFGATALTGLAPMTVTFTAAATDPDGDPLSLRWDIGGSRIVDGAASVTHTFTTPGTYGISLVATDPDGEWDQAVKWITVYPDTGQPAPGNQPPVASFSPQWIDREGPITQTFTSSSFDPDGDTLVHTWYFGDGSTSSGKTVTKTFPPGFIMSVLLVVDDGQATGQVAGEVTSRNPGSGPPANEPPTAAFTADPTSGSSPLAVAFASTSSDPDGDALTHTWYFGDGDTANGATAGHTYAAAGVYTATLVVSDGSSSTSASKTIVVNSYGPIHAGFTVSDGTDAAAAGSGARIVDNGVSQQASRPVTNISMPGVGGANEWWTTSGVTGDQQVIVHLAGNGSDLLDDIVLEGVPATSSMKTFSIALSRGNDPFGAYDTVIDHATLLNSRTPQSYPIAPTTGRFLKLTAHDNYGGPYLSLGRLRAMTVDRDGGIVSLNTGPPATIVSATSEYSTAYSADHILDSTTSAWLSLIDQKTDQRIRVKLGGEGPHEIAAVALRTPAASNAVTDVEVWTSLTGNDGEWTKVLDSGLAATAALQTLPVAGPAADANFVELRMSGTGPGRYLQLFELQALTTNGLNVALGTGVGAKVMDVSSESNTRYTADKAISPDATIDYWSTATGQTTGQFMTVQLRNGDAAVIDRATVTSAGNRPRNVKVQTSIDGVTYTTQASRRLLDSSEVQELRFAPTEARFVKLVIDDGYATASVRVDKFRVYAIDRGDATVPFVDTSVGSAPATAWAWDFGDGTTSTDQHPTHTFPGPGTYPVTLTVTDADSNTHSFTRPYTVAGALVTPSALTFATSATATLQGDGTYAIPELVYVNLTLGITDGAVAGWQWDLAHNPTTSIAGAISTSFPDDGTYEVRFRALTADWLWTPWQSRTFVVSNVAPVVEAGPVVTGLAGDVLRTTYSSVSDPADPLTCTWDWGDGTALEVVTGCTAANSRIPHTYAAAGSYTATLTADDGDGGVTSDTTTFEVAFRPTTLQITSTTSTGGALVVRTHLLDGTTGAPIVGAPLAIAADGGAPLTATTDATGRAELTLPGASGAIDVSASYGGTAAQAPEHVTRPVRAPKADIVFIIDESSSMSGVQAKVVEHLQTIIGDLTSTLDFRVGTVGYASGDINGFGQVRVPLTNDLTDIYDGLRRRGRLSWSANGYEGIVVGSGFTYDEATGELIDTGAIGQRPPAASCAVLISDAGVSEAGPDANVNGPLADYDAALEALQRRNTTLFSIIASWHAPTSNAYGTGPGGLAGLTGGDQWSISDFSNDPSGVLEALAAKCATKAVTPDLAVSLDVPAGPIATGGEVTWTATATNAAAIDTPGVQLVVTLPNGVAFGAAPGGGVWDAASRTVTWPAFGLDAGSHVLRSVTVRVDSGGWAPGDHALTASASVAHDGSLGPESDTSNNQATATTSLRVDQPTTTTTTPPETTTTTTPPGSTSTLPAPSSTARPGDPTTTVARTAAVDGERSGPSGQDGPPEGGPLPRTGPAAPMRRMVAAGALLALLGAALVARSRHAFRRG